jgi:hypothetical protein
MWKIGVRVISIRALPGEPFFFDKVPFFILNTNEIQLREARRKHMEFLERLDDRILMFFTNISHRFQRLTGRTNFFLAKVALFTHMFGAFISIANYWAPLMSIESGVVDVVVFMMTSLFSIIIVIWCEYAEKTFQSSGNLLKLEWPHSIKILVRPTIFFLRSFIVSVCFLAMQWIDVLIQSCLFGLVIGLYFVDVIPLPPGKSKIREWIELFGGLFRESVPVRVAN